LLKILKLFNNRNKQGLDLYKVKAFLFGVADGARTHDNLSHSQGLYQLSYGHHKRL
jgi:hypothetical protein